MVSQRAFLIKYNCLRFIVSFSILYEPVVDLDSSLSTVEANSFWIFQDDKLLLKWDSILIILSEYITSHLRWIIILVPVKVNSLAWQLWKLVACVKECYLHIMWKYKHTTQDMIVVIVPNIFISKRNHRFLLFDINDLETFFLKISNCQILIVHAEWLSISTQSLVDVKVYLRKHIWWRVLSIVRLHRSIHLINLDNFLRFVLDNHILVLHQSKWVRHSKSLCNLTWYLHCVNIFNLIW